MNLEEVDDKLYHKTCQSAVIYRSDDFGTSGECQSSSEGISDDVAGCSDDGSL